MCFPLAFGRCPSQSSLGSGRLPCGRHTRNASHEANITRARLHLALLEQPIAVLSSFNAEMVLLPPIARPCRLTSPSGSLRRFPMLAHAAIRATLRLHADRPGLPPPALLVSCICQPCFMLDRPWAPDLQRFLPARRRPSTFHMITHVDEFLPFLHAVSRLAAPRLRGFQPSCGRVLRRSRCSRVRRVAPLLVVFPLRG